jgi:hypothetical protein
MTTFTFPPPFDLAYGLTGLTICLIAGIMLYRKRQAHRR